MIYHSDPLRVFIASPFFLRYVYVELLDPATKVAVPGFDRHAFRILLDVDGISLPLAWGNQSVSSVGLAGRTVRARIGFRDAIVYAIGP